MEGEKKTMAGKGVILYERGKNKYGRERKGDMEGEKRIMAG
jgi:hypothetical protein